MDIAGKKVAYITLGCKLNFSETSTIRHSLEKAGTETVGEKEQADIFVINTCSVTDMAEKKGRQLIRKIISHNPGAYIVVVGCYAQLRAKEIMAIEGVSLVLGANDKFNVEHYLRHLEETERREPHSCDIFKLADFDLAYSFGDRTRCFLKIQDGCDYFCTYCTIPYARGRSRSASVPQVLQAVRDVAAKGIKEIILTGVNTGDFGRGSDENFLHLLHRLDEMDEIERYRISSIEPNLLTDEIIDFVAGSRHFMPHFHVPLQSGNNEVLKLMRRRYDRELFAAKMHKIKEMIPDAFIGVDTIVGMRGETRAYFEDARDFIESLPISQLHVFPYSERQGTKALEIPYIVSQEEKHHRVTELLQISERKHSAFYHQFEDTSRPVLFEDSKVGNHICGFTDNYIKVQLPYDKTLANQIIPITLTDSNLRLES
ncbi:MAG: tRNA (N(6)-L-threonylcarbamoyladenosine(37)-C(2))-methylthiotransferase MtaB [Odoribacter sp.]|nr:tRNA (N(6)-L-threonylcarbamoyladenosine(37)-C(2))-methylthiotransferase MtaB [Odoribacter sp.]